MSKHWNTHREPLSKDEINRLPLWRYEGPIHLIDRPEAVADAVACLRGEELLGFDTETRPTFRRGQYHPPALVQLAGETCAYVFQLQGCRFGDELASVLADPQVVKAGVAIDDDIMELHALHPFEAAGFVDVGDRARELDLSTHGLRNLTANLLGVRISKGAQRSNWGRRDLTPRQLQYAATDAWAGRMIYLAMKEKGML